MIVPLGSRKGGPVVRMFKKSEESAEKTGLKRVLSRGGGAVVDHAPIGRLKKFVLKLKERRATNKVVDAGHADAPVRTKRATVKKTIGDKANPAKQKLKKSPAKVPASKKAPGKVSASKKAPGKVTASNKTPAKKKIRRPQF